MSSITRYALSIILLSSVATSSYQNSAKLRRDGILNLYPFPRVGRANSHTWQLNDLLLRPEPLKRQLYAFPRVGRSETSHPAFQLSPQYEELLLGRRNPFVKRERLVEQMEGDAAGMWFGPRLGRGFRSEDDIQSDADKREQEQYETATLDRVKRQTIHG